MDVTLLCVGDVVGGPGRRILAEALPKIAAERGVDCNIVNVENAAAGSGLTPNLYEKFIAAGVNLMTLGDHIYRRKEIIPVLEKSERIVRPANLAPQAPGHQYAICETAGGARVAVLSLLGRMYMRTHADCPFRAADRVLGTIPDDVRIIVVDVHAEATAEKIALGWHLDGRVSAVVGTHTHVPTADECVLPKGTAYITDLGMTGPHDSVLGRRKDRVLSSMTTSVPIPFDVARNDARLSGVTIQVKSETGRATSIERISVSEGDRQPSD
jgi:metallophosphoesterase (TIGR00282 family)